MGLDRLYPPNVDLAMISVLRKLFEVKLPVVFPFPLTFSKSGLLDFSVADMIMGLIMADSLACGLRENYMGLIFSARATSRKTGCSRRLLKTSLLLPASCMTSVLNMRLGT